MHKGYEVESNAISTRSSEQRQRQGQKQCLSAEIM